MRFRFGNGDVGCHIMYWNVKFKHSIHSDQTINVPALAIFWLWLFIYIARISLDHSTIGPPISPAAASMCNRTPTATARPVSQAHKHVKGTANQRYNGPWHSYNKSRQRVVRYRNALVLTVGKCAARRPAHRPAQVRKELTPGPPQPHQLRPPRLPQWGHLCGRRLTPGPHTPTSCSSPWPQRYMVTLCTGHPRPQSHTTTSTRATCAEGD